MPSSNPHAWLRPIFAQLQAHPAFRHFAPTQQFEQLALALERDHPAKAATMREWSPAAQNGLLLHLASSVEQDGTAQTVELWRVRKGERELRCDARYLPNGIDMRLFEGDDFRRTQLVKDAIASTAVSEEWKQKLQAHGWAVISG
jgi:hypothetical protein